MRVRFKWKRHGMQCYKGLKGNGVIIKVKWAWGQSTKGNSERVNYHQITF